MNRKLVVLLALGCLAIAIAVTAPIVLSRQADNQFVQRTQVAQRSVDGNGMMGGDHMMCGDGMMGGDHMMCGDGMMGPGMMGDDGQDMQIVHQLFAYHDQIRRSVETVPGGVKTVTESDNPEIAALIQQHVASMHQRLEAGRWFAMMSQTLPTMFQNANRYQRQSQLTDNGVEVTKTSDDSTLAEVLHEHAQEITQYVENGMPGMGGGMMYRDRTPMPRPD
ncbi:hypothetical protein [Leptolyngbya iicbica]|uniref:DUF305 domain-containing protein n=2 Tax=Cyanophyceae TaxID=3028117 RepID=A0A4Q7E9K4_9CYAN|nr:hypothetical protein [Leptolyngbya sp. LK]RZM79099.1 hypothetical protein DYY88_10080 [Leptolyngbya sp. LK]